MVTLSHIANVIVGDRLTTERRLFLVVRSSDSVHDSVAVGRHPLLLARIIHMRVLIELERRREVDLAFVEAVEAFKLFDRFLQLPNIGFDFKRLN